MWEVLDLLSHPERAAQIAQVRGADEQRDGAGTPRCSSKSPNARTGSYCHLRGRVRTGLSPMVARRNGHGQERQTWRVPALPTQISSERVGRVEVAGENGPTGIGI